MDSQTVKTDEEITLPANSFTREGYSFAGWAESSEGNAVYTDKASYKMGTDDAELYAVWSANTNTSYTVEHYKQDVSGSGYTKVTADTESLTGTTGTTATASPKSYTGFRENTGHAGRIPSGAIAGDGSLVLKLYYDRDTYTVSFDSNGGSSVSDINGVRYETTISEPVNPSKIGYTFLGWYADEDLNIVWDFSTDPVTEAKTLYASWSADSHTLNFHANGGSGTMDSQTVKTDEEITLPATSFTREGYSFVGWAETSGGVVEYGAGTEYTMGNSDTVLYAKWGPYGIGVLGPSGGFIFYDDQIGYDLDMDGTIEVSEKNLLGDGLRFLEAAPAGWSGAAKDPWKVWGGVGTAVVGGTGTAIGTGASNTANIVATFGNAEPYANKTDYAAKVCAEYRGGGYDDWFLP